VFRIDGINGESVVVDALIAELDQARDRASP
jgi:hypothetical protein